MPFELRENSELEGWDLIDTDGDQSHDKDESKHWIATFYDEFYAKLVRYRLNELAQGGGQGD